MVRRLPGHWTAHQENSTDQESNQNLCLQRREQKITNRNTKEPKQYKALQCSDHKTTAATWKAENICEQNQNECKIKWQETKFISNYLSENNIYKFLLTKLPNYFSNDLREFTKYNSLLTTFSFGQMQVLLPDCFRVVDAREAAEVVAMATAFDGLAAEDDICYKQSANVGIISLRLGF